MNRPDARGKARETRDPRARTPSGCSIRTDGETMTDAPIEGTPAPTTPDLQKAIEELKAANVALVEKLTAIEEKNKGYDAKITALTGAAQDRAKAELGAAHEKAKSDLEIAYEKAMRDLGVIKDE